MIQIDISKAKEIAHEKRRASRAVEFAPLDTEATIPAMSEQAEAKRAEIREKYAEIQEQIDEANSVDVLKDIITQL
jgi:Spy/CpxP family protein refolding chaperone